MEVKVNKKPNGHWNIFRDPHGERVLNDLKKRFHFLTTTDGDPLKEGERRVVLYIMSQITKLEEKGNKK